MGLYHLCSQNKGADQLCGYCAAGRRLIFSYAKRRFPYDTGMQDSIYHMTLNWHIIFDFVVKHDIQPLVNATSLRKAL